MEYQHFLREGRKHRVRVPVLAAAMFLAVYLAPGSILAWAGRGGAGLSARSVAVFAGHTQFLIKDGNHQGVRSASGMWEYRYNDRVAELFAARSTKELEYKVIPATLNIPFQSRALVAAMAGAHALLEIHHDGVQPRFRERLIGAAPRDPLLSYYRGFSLHVYPGSAGAALARDIESSMIAAGLAWSTYHTQDVPDERMTLIPKTRAVYARDQLALLRLAQMPAVIIECGCIENPSEDDLLKHRHYQEKIVDAIDRAVREFFHKQKGPS